MITLIDDKLFFWRASEIEKGLRKRENRGIKQLHFDVSAGSHFRIGFWSGWCWGWDLVNNWRSSQVSSDYFQWLQNFEDCWFFFCRRTWRREKVIADFCCAQEYDRTWKSMLGD